MTHARPAIPKAATAAIAAVALMALGALAPAVVPPAAAQDALVPTPAPEGPRPYPYAVLGQQPGGLPEPTHEALEAELGADILLRPEEIVMQLPAPDGRIFEFTFPQYMQTPRPAYAAFGGDDETYDRFGLLLATDALEGRVLGISRTLRAPNAEAPDYAALRAQLVGPLRRALRRARRGRPPRPDLGLDRRRPRRGPPRPARALHAVRDRHRRDHPRGLQALRRDVLQVPRVPLRLPPPGPRLPGLRRHLHRLAPNRPGLLHHRLSPLGLRARPPPRRGPPTPSSSTGCSRARTRTASPPTQSPRT